MTERPALRLPGFVMVIAAIGLVAGGIALIRSGVDVDEAIVRPAPVVAGALLLVVAGLMCAGFTIVQPNESKVVTFLGRYLGTIRNNGFGWTWPITNRKTVTLRVRNFDSDILKVNDFAGNPIEVAAVVVWRVVETAKASFEVDDYEGFVKIQTETAVRHMASLYPYDQYEEGQVSLRSHADEVTTSLNTELQQQLSRAGVEVMGTQLRRLAYSPEIAGDMLRRQQAEAVVAARKRIVEGAVAMVEDALQRLSEKRIVELDDERKATMVSNLLVVLCSEHHAQPVVNTGTLYQ